MNKIEELDDKKYSVKLFATVVLAIICVYYMYLNKGISGIGWFIFGLLIIWE